MKQLPAINNSSLVLNLLQGLPNDYNLSHPEKILNSVERSICNLKENPQKLHGIRAEKMFGYIAASLGECHFVKQEDAGISYVTSEIAVPDYRLILKNGSEFFIEVKNNHGRFDSLVKLNESYIFKMLNYPGVTLDNLKIAIYWSRFHFWTLISIKEFSKKNGKYSIKMKNAVIKNEMGLLGDVLFGVEAPLTIEIITDPSEPSEITENGIGNFTTKDVQLYTGKGLVEKDTVEYGIIFDAVLYGLGGRWNEENYVKTNNNKIEKIIFNYHPCDENKRFAILTSLSRIATCKYNLNTTKNGVINRLQITYEESLHALYRKIQPLKLYHLFILKYRKDKF